MIRHFIFFINPISGTRNKEALRSVIQAEMDKTDFRIQFNETDKDGNYSYLPEKIIAEKITDIVICGGDGTISQVVAHLLNCKINVGIIPMGSGNGLAFAAGISKNVSKAMQIILTGEAIDVDGFYINGLFSCMLCGLGFDAQVAHDFSIRKKRGLATYIEITARNFISAKPYLFSMFVNDAEINTEAYFISIANSNQFGNHVTIAPEASLTDGLLDIVIVRKMSKLNMVYSLLKQIKMGRIQNVTTEKFKTSGVQYIQAKKLLIKNHSAAPLHIDGEPVSSPDTINIAIVEKAFRLIHPNV